MTMLAVTREQMRIVARVLRRNPTVATLDAQDWELYDQLDDLCHRITAVATRGDRG